MVQTTLKWVPVWVLTSFAVYLLFVIATVGSGPSMGQPTRIILPDGFTGEFSIVKDRLRGEDLVFEDGFWVFRIPQSGVLTIKDDEPLYRWHGSVVQSANGKHVEVKDMGTYPGERKTGPNSSKSSTDYEKTKGTHLFSLTCPRRLVSLLACHATHAKHRPATFIMPSIARRPG